MELDQEKFSVKHMCNLGMVCHHCGLRFLHVLLLVILMYKFKVLSDIRNTKKHNCASYSLLNLFLDEAESLVLLI